jgi:hypothetical protein
MRNPGFSFVQPEQPNGAPIGESPDGCYDLRRGRSARCGRTGAPACEVGRRASRAARGESRGLRGIVFGVDAWVVMVSSVPSCSTGSFEFATSEWFRSLRRSIVGIEVSLQDARSCRGGVAHTRRRADLVGETLASTQPNNAVRRRNVRRAGGVVGLASGHDRRVETRRVALYGFRRCCPVHSCARCVKAISALIENGKPMGPITAAVARGRVRRIAGMSG